MVILLQIKIMVTSIFSFVWSKLFFLFFFVAYGTSPLEPERPDHGGPNSKGMEAAGGEPYTLVHLTYYKFAIRKGRRATKLLCRKVKKHTLVHAAKIHKMKSLFRTKRNSIH
jgi:hypothetical protein